MKMKIVAVLIVPTLITGCITGQKGASGPGQETVATASWSERNAASKNLAQARELIEQGKTAAAERLLAAVTSGKPVPGVTDESLFRLALLSLQPAPERATSTVQAHQLLHRLSKEYPNSIWTHQSAQLAELLNVVEDLRRQNRNLKANNQSLNAEKDTLNRKVDELDGKVRQLNKNLDQLKHLDRELERRAR